MCRPQGRKEAGEGRLPRQNGTIRSAALSPVPHPHPHPHPTLTAKPGVSPSRHRTSTALVITDNLLYV